MYQFNKIIDGVSFCAPSTRKNKKYDAFVNGKKYSFGDVRYEQYHDKIGFYNHLDHRDLIRRDNYRSRHRHENLNDFSPAYFSWFYLWT